MERDGHDTPPEPATCALPPHELTGRIDAWQALDAHALQRRVSPGQVVTTYPDRPAIAQQLQALIAAEQECCSFLAFDVHHRGQEIEVVFRYPPEFVTCIVTSTSSRRL